MFDSVVPTAQIHQSVTSHYSVFKQHRSFHRHPPLFSSVSFNLALFGFLSNPNLKIFQFFFGFSRYCRSNFLYQHCSISWRMRFNIALFVNLSNDFLKKIQKKQDVLRLTSHFSASNSLKMRWIRQNMPDSQESLP